MQLRQIFSKDIERNINPAVVVSEQDKTTVQTEIEEYVFTEALIDNLYKFLYEIFNQKNGKTAIWINGYYGSGKSHFIKYAHSKPHAAWRQLFQVNRGCLSADVDIL